MRLSEEDLTAIAKTIKSEKKMRKVEFEKFLMYNGAVKSVVEKAIKSEFKRKETITELMNRLVPLNIMKKIVDKLAGVYKEAPTRSVANEDTEEQKVLDMLEDSLEINVMMKEANRDFKRSKKALIEIYRDDEENPALRVVPPHLYRAFAIRKKKKSKPNVIAKIDEANECLYIWSDESYFITDLDGEIKKDRMVELNNEQAENDYGVLPFVYINESSNSIDPIQDDDLYGISMIIPLLLTDLLFGLKYQCWSMIWTVGFKGDLDFNPNSITHLDFGEEGEVPSINQIKPDIDSDKLLTVILSIMSFLLTTKNLKVENLDSNLTVQNAASGLSKMLDNAESVEDKKDQQAYFLIAERELFAKVKIMYNFWYKNNLLNKEFKRELPEDFKVVTTLKEPTPLISESEKIATSKSKIDAKLSTIKRELKRVNPDMKDKEIEALYQEILDEQKLLAQRAPIAPESTPQDDNDEEEESEEV